MKDITLTIHTKRALSQNLWEFTLVADEPLPPIRCGQFLHLRLGGAFLLRRPFCIYKFTENSVTIVAAVVGKGTRYLAALDEGTRLSAVLPIGNGFTLEENHRKIVLLGGGVGCAPLVTVPVTYPDREYISYLGFADKSAVQFTDDFTAFGKTVVATDNGSYGRHGYVTDVLRADLPSLGGADVILTCGPTPMLKAAARLSLDTGIPAYMSGESHMGCGVGACLVCVCDIKEKNGEIVRKRACVDGPVFRLEDIIL